MPTVAIAHTQEKHRTFDRLYSLVEEALDHLGGFDSFVKPGQMVLIKPDQSVPRLTETGSTTDPLLVAVLIRMAQYVGAGKILVGASSSGFTDSLECMRVTGVAEIAKQLGVEVVDLGSDRLPNQHYQLPDGRILHSATLPLALLEADVVIAAPKARTNYLDSIAVSLEYCSGCLNQTWRALQMESGDPLQRLADTMIAIRPDLWITDALICGEGDGPHESSPHWCGAVIASADPVATDTMVARVLKHDPSRLTFSAALGERGLGEREPLVSMGTPVERLAFAAWPAHMGTGYLPVQFLVGKGVDETGTIGHVKSALETLLQQGVLQHWIHDAGTPTIMLGDVDDGDFEQHLREGPYIVVDSAAQAMYRNDPRVSFIAGHPVTANALPELRNIIRTTNKAPRSRTQARAATALGALAVGAMIWNRNRR